MAKRPEAIELAKAFVSHRTQKEASESLNVSESRYGEWIREPAVQLEIDTLINASWRETTQRLRSSGTLALDTLTNLVEHAKHETVKLNASKAILEFGIKFTEIDLGKKLEAIEESINSLHNGTQKH